MAKKNRFSMLEIKKNENQSITPKVSKEEKAPPVPKQFKVIIEEDEFKKNLEQHRLTEKIKTIEKQKIDIKINVQLIKKYAYLKIGIGILIILVAFNKYYALKEIKSEVVKVNGGYDFVTYANVNEMTSSNYVILILLISLFTYLYFSGKNKGKK
jgi:hypothetical protein